MQRKQVVHIFNREIEQPGGAARRHASVVVLREAELFAEGLEAVPMS